LSAAIDSQLNRQTFTTSRELEYFTEQELVTQTGYSRQEWFPRVLLKELVDNSLDAAETAGVPPVITITLDEDALTVSDNGPGIPADVVGVEPE
jgi:DNA topoisomerase VI subunit B